MWELCSTVFLRADILQEFERLPSPDDWKRFMKYSTKVRLLIHQRSKSIYPLHQSTFDTVARTRTTLNILPNVHTVSWQNPNLNLCILFMHANIRQFTFFLPLNRGSDPRPFFLEITSRMPHLTNLDVRSFIPMHTIETDMISLIEQLPKLKKITFPRFYLTTKVAEALSRLSHLEIIEFQYSAEQGYGDPMDVTPFVPILTEGAFPSLYDHSMSTTFDDAARFINTKFSPTNLTMLYIDSDFIEPPSSIHNFLSVVADNCQLLKSLALVSLRDASSSEPDVDQATDVDITLDVLKPLLKLPNLSMMELIHQHQLALSQVDIELLASSWPSLETLILNNEPVYLSRSKLTLKALLPFAKHCHKLSHLGLFLDATSVDESFYQPNLIPFRNLKRLSMGVSIITDSESVSLYLSRILPLGCKLDSGITWDETTEINDSISIKIEERCQAWSKVAEMLPMLCTLRMQERERTRTVEKELEDLRMRSAIMSDMVVLGVRDNSSCIMI